MEKKLTEEQKIAVLFKSCNNFYNNLYVLTFVYEDEFKKFDFDIPKPFFYEYKAAAIRKNHNLIKKLDSDKDYKEIASLKASSAAHFANQLRMSRKIFAVYMFQMIHEIFFKNDFINVIKKIKYINENLKSNISKNDVKNAIDEILKIAEMKKMLFNNNKIETKYTLTFINYVFKNSVFESASFNAAKTQYDESLISLDQYINTTRTAANKSSWCKSTELKNEYINLLNTATKHYLDIKYYLSCEFKLLSH